MRCWVRDSKNAWLPAVCTSVEVTAASNATATSAARERYRIAVRMSDGTERTIDTSAESGPAGAADELADVKLANDGGVEEKDVDDAMRLSVLNEPAALQLLQERYSKHKIYTYTGPILLALNPFSPLPMLYGADMLANYYSMGLLRSSESPGDLTSQSATAGFGATSTANRLPPHVYAIADDAYRSMVDGTLQSSASSSSSGSAMSPLAATADELARDVNAASSSSSSAAAAPPLLPLLSRHINQSMLVSGESGAGKTETAKLCMQYLATVGRSSAASATGAVIEYKGGVAVMDTSAEGDGDATPLTSSGGQGGAAGLSVEQRVLDSNPILEAFGNAKTVRNENSSRFGKFIQLQFDRRGCLCGAFVSVYLLEKGRLVSAGQGQGERNFHILHQMLAGGRQADMEGWDLVDRTKPSKPRLPPSSFAYTAGVGGAGSAPLTGVSDAAAWEATVHALGSMGFDGQARRDVFTVLASLLHLGNVDFETHATSVAPGGTSADVNSDRSVVTHASRPSLETCARLMGVDARSLARVLVASRIEVRGQVTYRPFNPATAADTRDAVAKAVYGRLFHWLVRRVNLCIRNDDKARSFIGVLDIFGFEVFPVNSFEQLCINFANETLQAMVNAYAYRLEVLEYGREGIVWNSGNARGDNEDVLSLIAARPPRTPGLLALLDEACLTPQGSDTTFVRRAYEAFKGHARFEAGHLLKASEQFIIRHYACDVVYTSAGFVDKNRDSLHGEAIEVMASSSHPIIKELFATSFMLLADEADASATGHGSSGATAASYMPQASPASASSSASTNDPASAAAASARLKMTVGAQFTAQLRRLLDVIQTTKAHYIRCLKPNEEGRPGVTDRVSLVAQLRSGGVLEAVRVTRLGYPTRLSHREAVARYRPVAAARLLRLQRMAGQQKQHGGSAGAMGGSLRRGGMAAAMASSSASSSGGTHGVVPVTMVDLRDRRLHEGKDPSKVKQAVADCLRVLGAPRDADGLGYQVGSSQVFFRRPCYDALEKLRSQEYVAAACAIQRVAKGFIGRTRWVNMRAAVLRLQCSVRCWLARRRVKALRQAKASICIQAFMRRWQTRRNYTRLLHAVARMQACLKRRRQRAAYVELRRQAAASRIACTYRMSVARRQYRAARGAAVIIQSLCRMIKCRRIVARKRADAAAAHALRESLATQAARIVELEALVASTTAACEAAEARRSAEQEQASMSAAASSARIRDLESTLATRDTAIAGLSSDLAASQGAASSLRIRLAEVEAQAAAAARQWERQAAAEAATQADLRGRLAAAEEEAGKQRSRAEDAETRVSDLTSQLSAAESKLSQVSSQLQASQGESAAQSSRAAAAEDECSRLRSQVADVLFQVERARADAAVARDELAQARASASAAQEQLSADHEAAAAAASEVRAEAERRSEDARMAQLEQQAKAVADAAASASLAATLKLRSQLEPEIARLQAALEEEVRGRAKAEAMLADHRDTAVAAAHADANRLQSGLASSQAMVASLQAQVSTLEMAIASSDAKLAAVTSEHEAAVARFTTAAADADAAFAARLADVTLRADKAEAAGSEVLVRATTAEAALVASVSEVALLRADLQTAITGRVAAEAAASSTQASLEESRRRLASTEASLAAAKEDADTLRKRLAELQARMEAEAASGKSVLQEEVAKAQAAAAASAEMAAALTAQLSSHRSELEAATSRAATAEAALLASQASVTEASERADQLFADLQVMQRQKTVAQQVAAAELSSHDETVPVVMVASSAALATSAAQSTAPPPIPPTGPSSSAGAASSTTAAKRNGTAGAGKGGWGWGGFGRGAAASDPSTTSSSASGIGEGKPPSGQQQQPDRRSSILPTTYGQLLPSLPSSLGLGSIMGGGSKAAAKDVAVPSSSLPAAPAVDHPHLPHPHSASHHPVIGDKEKAAAQLAAALMASGTDTAGLRATASPAPVTDRKGSRTSITSTTTEAAAVDPTHASHAMAALGSDGVPIRMPSGATHDVMALARHADGDTDTFGMIGEVLREMGSQMVGLKKTAEHATREAKESRQAREEATAKADKATAALAALESKIAMLRSTSTTMRRELDDSNSKMSAMESLAEAASGVKLQLARQLEATRRECADLKETVEELRLQVVEAKARAQEEVMRMAPQRQMSMRLPARQQAPPQSPAGGSSGRSEADDAGLQLAAPAAGAAATSSTSPASSSAFSAASALSAGPHEPSGFVYGQPQVSPQEDGAATVGTPAAEHVGVGQGESGDDDVNSPQLPDAGGHDQHLDHVVEDGHEGLDEWR